MRAQDIESREEELNEERKARQESNGDDDSIVEAVEETVDRLVKPLINRPEDPEDLEERREENDREQRSGS
jgi:hypothetical protein